MALETGLHRRRQDSRFVRDRVDGLLVDVDDVVATSAAIAQLAAAVRARWGRPAARVARVLAHATGRRPA
jgi:hypothetical protein